MPQPTGLLIREVGAEIFGAKFSKVMRRTRTRIKSTWSRMELRHVVGPSQRSHTRVKDKETCEVVFRRARCRGAGESSRAFFNPIITRLAAKAA